MTRPPRPPRFAAYDKNTAAVLIELSRRDAVALVDQLTKLRADILAGRHGETITEDALGALQNASVSAAVTQAEAWLAGVADSLKCSGESKPEQRGSK